MSKAKSILFDDIASELALLSDADRAEFAEYLFKNYEYTAVELARDIGFAEMDKDYAPYDDMDSYRISRENLLL